MNMSVLNFKSVITNIARASLFYVEMASGPPVLRSQWSTRQAEIMSFTCKAASLPQDTFSKIPVAFFGREVGFYGKRQYSDWNTTIGNTNSFEFYRFLWEWHRLMNDQKDNVAITTNMNQYKTDLNIRLTDVTGGGASSSNVNGIVGVKLCGVWPMSIGDMSLDWNADQQLDMQVTWSYDWTEMLSDTSTASS